MCTKHGSNVYTVTVVVKSGRTTGSEETSNGPSRLGWYAASITRETICLFALPRNKLRIRVYQAAYPGGVNIQFFLSYHVAIDVTYTVCRKETGHCTSLFKQWFKIDEATVDILTSPRTSHVIRDVIAGCRLILTCSGSLMCTERMVPERLPMLWECGSPSRGSNGRPVFSSKPP